MTDTQPIPLATSSSDDRSKNSRVGRPPKGADTDTLTDAPDSAWEGLVSKASFFSYGRHIGVPTWWAAFVLQ